MNKHDFPQIHFYDQDFVDIYNKTWSWVSAYWFNPASKEQDSDGLFIYPENNKYVVNQFESILSTFFLVYSNRNFDACKNIDYFYSRQEENGAIRWKYDVDGDKAVLSSENPQGVGLPLFAFAEYNLFHKSANKKRIKEVMPYLQKYMTWLETSFKQENGLFAVPVTASSMLNSPREDAYYPVDFNACMAINASYMSALGDILNDKDLSFQYKKMYFSIKTRINSMMWDDETGFYYDLDKAENRLNVKTIAAYWTMLAEIPNADKADRLVEHLNDSNSFGTEHPFPTLSVDNPNFSEDGNGWCGSVMPAFNFIVIKGLEKYGQYELARECAIRHLYFVLETLMPNEKNEPGDLYEAYCPNKEGCASMSDDGQIKARPRYLLTVGLSTIALMIENVIGLSISLPRKTVDWIIPNLEIMGIEKLSLKRNLITILSNKSSRGWEIQMESEKLYYFTINILDQKKKTLPIPSGKCTMLIDKL